MNNILKLITLFLTFNIVVSCRLFPGFKCSDSYNPATESFNGKIKFNEYYSTAYTPPYIYTEKLIFYEDKKFSYLKIAYEKDTTQILNGKFDIYKDGKYPWHILKLSADSIYTKQKINDSLSDSIIFSPNFEATKFSGFPTSGYKIIMDDILSNTINRISTDSLSIDSTCFDLGKKTYDNDNYCNNGYYNGFKRSFCLKQPEEIENKQNLIGDKL